MEVRIRIINRRGLLCVFSFQIGGFAIHDCKLVENRHGRRIVVMPENRNRQNIVHPLDKQTREKLTAEVSAAYDVATGLKTDDRNGVTQ